MADKKNPLKFFNDEYDNRVRKFQNTTLKNSNEVKMNPYKQVVSSRPFKTEAERDSAINAMINKFDISELDSLIKTKSKKN